MAENKRHNEFLEKYQQSRSAYGGNINDFKTYRNQYDGTKEMDKGQAANIVWNFTFELINSTISSSIPPVKVTPRKPTVRHLRNARIIEDLCRNEIDRLPFEYINDEDERNCKIDGGTGFLIEWDNLQRTHNTVGEINIRNLQANQIIPQQAVYFTQYMDYIFLTFDDTKSRIKSRYGKDVENESIDSTASEEFSTADDIVTQVVCYYMNKRGYIGCISWAGTTVLIDDENYEARKNNVCVKCGKTQPVGEEKCSCGSEQWEKKPKDFETIYEDIQLSDGRVIPAMSPAKDENGEFITEPTEAPVFDQMTGDPILEYLPDEQGQNVLRQRTEPQQRVVNKNTEIPYYYPRKFPAVIRRNVSKAGEFMGISDCGVIHDLQQMANKIFSKAYKKTLKAGSYLAKPADLNIELNDEDVNPINVTNPQQMQMLQAIRLDFLPERDLSMLNRIYEMAKSLLRITDSYQGKADNTAMSGRAKEAQIQQSMQNQLPPLVMKKAAYAEVYEMIFKFALAYMDEPRSYVGTDVNSKPVERIFNRYEFLEQDENGNWYYDDGYLFSVDESGVDANNKLMMLDDLRTDFGMGAYGNPADPETMLLYWKEKEALGYPNAQRNVEHWENKVAQMKQQQAMQQPPPAAEGMFPAGADMFPAGADMNMQPQEQPPNLNIPPQGI